MSGANDSDLVEHVSAFDFGNTLERLSRAIEQAGMAIYARIDHAAGAQNVGLAMPPTTVLIYGSPRGGTPIMLAVPQTALDLPLRVLVREALDRRTVIAFHPIAAALVRAGVEEALAKRLEPAQQLLLKAVSV